MKKLTLTYPIKINGHEVTELTFDETEISGVQFAAANRAYQRMMGNDFSALPSLDPTYQMYLGFAAVLAVNPQYSFEDLQNLRWTDCGALQQIGLRFFVQGADSLEKACEVPIANTQGLSTSELPI